MEEWNPWNQKWEIRKTEEDMRCSKRYAIGLFLCRKTVAEGFIAKQKSSLILLLQWVLQWISVFKKRNLVQSLHKTTSALTWKSHGQHMWIWLVIKVTWISKIWNIFFLWQEKTFSWIKLDLLTALLTHNPFKKKSVTDRIHKEIKSILCSVVREEIIGCFEKTIGCFFAAATMFEI